MPIKILSAFAKMAYSGFSLIGKNDLGREQVKTDWAQELLKTLGFKLNIRGTPPEEGAMILVGNHVSYLDIPTVMASTSGVTFIAKNDLLKWPIVGRGAKAAGTIFVSRETGNDRTIARKQVTESLRAGKNSKIVVFPSGTTRLNESLPWKKGVFEIAKEAQVPVQLFRIDYQPLREAAYVDDDNLLVQMNKVTRVKNKTVTLTWLDCFDRIDDPSHFAEMLREKVRAD